MKCENDSTEVYPGQDLATANYYPGQHAACQSIDEAVMKSETVRTPNQELERRIDPGDQKAGHSAASDTHVMSSIPGPASIRSRNPTTRFGKLRTAYGLIAVALSSTCFAVIIVRYPDGPTPRSRSRPLCRAAIL